MTQFKIGDRVRYTGAKSLKEDGEHLSPREVGKIGTIKNLPPEASHNGEWDDGSKWYGYYSGNLELIEPDRLTRLEAFVARVANGPFDVDFHREAKALVAEIAPVDSDLIEARRIAVMVSKQTGKNAERFLSGAHDESFAVRCAVEALRQSRKEGPAS